MELEQQIRYFQSTWHLSELQLLTIDIAKRYHYESCALFDFEPEQRSNKQHEIGRVSVLMKSWMEQHDEIILKSLKQNPCSLFHQLICDGKTTPNGFALAPVVGGVKRAYVVIELPAELDANLVEQVAWYWMILTQYMVDCYRRCLKNSHKKIDLTPRECECLKWGSCGKTSWDIGQILGISERTVNFHIQNCISKTNSVNRQQAISKCLISGVI